MNFYIMNKDTPVAEIICSDINGIEQIYLNNIINNNIVPLSIRNGLSINDWIRNRLVMSHRKDIMKMFKSIGITKTADILQVTKGISLNDTYWIKSATSKTTWSSVSPYRNSLNKEIADYSFTSSRTVSNKQITHSPDFATSGNFPKCWKRINNKI